MQLIRFENGAELKDDNISRSGIHAISLFFLAITVFLDLRLTKTGGYQKSFSLKLSELYQGNH